MFNVPSLALGGEPEDSACSFKTEAMSSHTTETATSNGHLGTVRALKRRRRLSSTCIPTRAYSAPPSSPPPTSPLSLPLPLPLPPSMPLPLPLSLPLPLALTSLTDHCQPTETACDDPSCLECICADLTDRLEAATAKGKEQDERIAALETELATCCSRYSRLDERLQSTGLVLQQERHVSALEAAADRGTIAALVDKLESAQKRIRALEGERGWEGHGRGQSKSQSKKEAGHQSGTSSDASGPARTPLSTSANTSTNSDISTPATATPATTTSSNSKPPASDDVVMANLTSRPCCPSTECGSFGRDRGSLSPPSPPSASSLPITPITPPAFLLTFNDMPEATETTETVESSGGIRAAKCTAISSTLSASSAPTTLVATPAAGSCTHSTSCVKAKASQAEEELELGSTAPCTNR